MPKWARVRWLVAPFDQTGPVSCLKRVAPPAISVPSVYLEIADLSIVQLYIVLSSSFTPCFARYARSRERLLTSGSLSDLTSSVTKMPDVNKSGYPSNMLTHVGLAFDPDHSTMHLSILTAWKEIVSGTHHGANHLLSILYIRLLPYAPTIAH